MKAIVIIHESRGGCDIFDTETGIVYSLGIGSKLPYVTVGSDAKCIYYGAHAVSFARQLAAMLDQGGWYTAEVRALILDMEDSLKEEKTCTKN